MKILIFFFFFFKVEMKMLIFLKLGTKVINLLCDSLSTEAVDIVWHLHLAKEENFEVSLWKETQRYVWMPLIVLMRMVAGMSISK